MLEPEFFTDDEYGVVPRLVTFGVADGNLQNVDAPAGCACDKCGDIIVGLDSGVCLPSYDEDGWSMLPLHSHCFASMLGLGGRTT